MTTPKVQHIAILGATKGMGRALARAAASRGAKICLLGRDPDELVRSAADLQVRAAAAGHTRPAPSTVRCDLADPASHAQALQAAEAELGSLDVVIVTAGAFATAAAFDADLALARQVLDLDFTCTILFCEAARLQLLARGGGQLVVFGSVAGERGRKPVGIYGAAKAGLHHYLESLDHRYAAAGLRVLTVKPGFVRTAMTAGLPEPPFAGEPEAVAARVLRAMDRGASVVYAPPIWALVMLVIRWLPRAVMRRVGF